MPCFAGLFGEGGHGRAQAGAARRRIDNKRNFNISAIFLFFLSF